MKVYVFTAHQAIDCEVLEHHVEVFSSKEDAVSTLKQWRDDCIEDDKNRGWDIADDSPDHYEAYEEGWYATNHVELTIEECKLQEHEHKKLESMISEHAYNELESKVAQFVGDEASEFIFPAVKKALEMGEGNIRENILIDWLNVDSMRVCTNCGAIMENGWYMNTAGYACSDECAAEMEGITDEQFRKWRIYKDDIADYLEEEGKGRKIEDLTKEECDAIIDDY